MRETFNLSTYYTEVARACCLCSSFSFSGGDNLKNIISYRILSTLLKQNFFYLLLIAEDKRNHQLINNMDRNLVSILTCFIFTFRSVTYGTSGNSANKINVDHYHIHVILGMQLNDSFDK